MMHWRFMINASATILDSIEINITSEELMEMMNQ